jgi:hypothetical protein
LGFFDFYIIPLARKLKECIVFGIARQEYLLYAEANQKEWALKGKEVVKGYLATYQQQPPELLECSKWPVDFDAEDEDSSHISC